MGDLTRHSEQEQGVTAVGDDNVSIRTICWPL